MTYCFTQIDVFTDTLTYGNALAVVHDADTLSEEQMARFANWTNLAETVFLTAPTHAEADYRARIFTPERELPFAGHPTLGAASVRLAAGGRPRAGDCVIQECGAGDVPVRQRGDRLAFAAPALFRSGAVDAADLGVIAAGLRLEREDIVDAQWADNGSGWVAVLLHDADTVLAIEPDYAAMAGFNVGVVGRHESGQDADFEVRALITIGTPGKEDPVTGSLNASVAQWLIATGRAPASYTAAQGARLGRRGRIHIEQEADTIWVGGQTVIGIRGELSL